MKSNSIVISPHLLGGGHIDFGADPFRVGVGFSACVTLSCLHNILLTSGWNLTLVTLT